MDTNTIPAADLISFLKGQKDDNDLKDQAKRAVMESENVHKDRARAFAEMYHAERLREDMVHNIPKASKEKKCNCARTGNKECSVKAKDDVMSRWKARSIALRLFGDK